MTDVTTLAETLASMPPDTIFSHRTAAAIWGLWLPHFDGIEVTTPANLKSSRYTTSVQRRLIIAHRRLMDDGDACTHLGLPVTSPVRTWLDLAPLLDIHDLVAAGDSALRGGALQHEFAARVRNAKRLRGVRRARVAVELLNARSRSRPESRIRSAIVLAGLPEPSVNEAVRDRFGGWLAEPDLHYRKAKIALEYNGAEHATERRMRKDSTRLLDLQREDWAVRTYTAAHAFARLHEVPIEVARLLRQRAPELLAQVHLARRVTYSEDQRRRNRRL